MTSPWRGRNKAFSSSHVRFQLPTPILGTTFGSAGMADLMLLAHKWVYGTRQGRAHCSRTPRLTVSPPTHSPDCRCCPTSTCQTPKSRAAWVRCSAFASHKRRALSAATTLALLPSTPSRPVPFCSRTHAQHAAPIAPSHPHFAQLPPRRECTAWGVDSRQGGGDPFPWS